MDTKKACDICGKILDSSDASGHTHESSKVCKKCGQIASDGHVRNEQNPKESSQKEI